MNTENGTFGLIQQINYGYDELEPIILSLMAVNRNFMLIGRHGTGKTRLAKTLSAGYGQQNFVFYDATKDDLISIAGIPDPKAIKEGRLNFVGHERSIWKKTTIVVDEITRAGKENQNLWLEILEERTCFGLPLVYEILIATANPESYAAAFQLDEALLDRFHAVIPVPEMQTDVEGHEIMEMLRLSLADPCELPDHAAISGVLAEIRKARSALIKDGIQDKIFRYLARLIPAMLRILNEQNSPYLSPRTYSRNLPETILAVSAYYHALGRPHPAIAAAKEALTYAVATKLQVKLFVLESLHNACAELLGGATVSKAESLRSDLAAKVRFKDKLQFMQEHWKDTKTLLGRDELEAEIGSLLRMCEEKGELDRIVALYQFLKGVEFSGEALRQVEGRVTVHVMKVLNRINPLLIQIADENGRKDAPARRNARIIREKVKNGSFLDDQSPDAIKIKRYLIDILEGDVSGDIDELREMLGRVNLA